MFTIKAAKGSFFDSAKVVKAVDAATRRALSRAGAFVRTAARSSIRKRKRASAPGSPPSSHTGLLRRFIFFAYDAGSKSVVIGPAALNAKGENAPEALEYGGPAVVTEGRKRKRVNVAARPYMGPAMAKEAPKFPDIWRDSIR